MFQALLDDAAESPGAAAVAAQGLIAGLEQGIGALAQAAQGAVYGVLCLLVDRQLPVFGLLERDREGLRLALVA
jgi:hypothetical protein